MKNIALIYGGNSSEFDISVESGRQVSAHIDRARYNVYDVLLQGENWTVQLDGTRQTAPVDKADFSFTFRNVKTPFDCAFILIHGSPGEDGLLQAYFDLLHIPYTSCNAFVSMLTFNKYATKCLLRDAGLALANDVYVAKNRPIDYRAIIRRLGLPLFVKPNTSGSSYGVTKVKQETELPDAFAAAFAESDAAIAEEYIDGRELQQGVLTSNGQTIALPVTEIISYNEFFDYEAKYKGRSAEITPANITPPLARRLADCSAHIYDRLGCRGVVRIDYIVRRKTIYFLEINTIPGMSPASIVPKQLHCAGITLRDACTALIDNALATHRPANP
ncbi:MAG: D-alanine--D-alanine ligase [Prevotellaceae bacterium]|jgi:D-alanine-D-alanine ligase|nr:D-alanine--D-alanine ligase [Prevotellaceae bacterium]